MKRWTLALLAVGFTASALAGGVLNMLLASTTAQKGSLTVGTSGVVSGYRTTGTVGSLSPIPRLLCGISGLKSVTGAYADTTHDFVIESDINCGQTVFNTVEIIDGAGTPRSYAAGSATWVAGSWSWGTGSSRVFSSGDNGKVRILTVTPSY